MMNNMPIVCEVSRNRHRNAALWLNLWTILLYIFGLAILIFIVLSIAFYIKAEWLLGAITTVGTIVQGPVIKWLLDRRKEAKEEEKVTFDAFNRDCRDVTVALDEATILRERLKLFGRFL